ncbi:DUF1201 domain-containing protein [Flammeovirga kamogawensis]|nr:DUF1201 domain-containing protein [Flammeovirga kamogawensis]
MSPSNRLNSRGTNYLLSSFSFFIRIFKYSLFNFRFFLHKNNIFRT